MTNKKESPWFKFKVNDWITGDIQSMSYHFKGVFVDLKAYYWSRDCDVEYKKACAKFKASNIDALIEADIVKLDGTKIRIDFLVENWDEVQSTSTKNTVNAKKRWGKEETQKPAPALPEAPAGINFFRIKDKLYKEAAGDYFKRTNSVFLEQWQMNHPKEKITVSVLTRMNNECVGKMFNDEQHIQNTFKKVWEKVVKDPVESGSNVKATGYIRGQKPIGG